MATCDPLSIDGEETGFAANQQTEPLDLCVGVRESGPMFVGYYPEFVDCGKLSEDEDVIFIKEYQEKTVVKRCKRMSAKDAPRRNPTRRARSNKHFQEFANGNFEGIDFIDDEDDMEAFPTDGDESFAARQEDSEDWNVEYMLKKNRQKRRKMPYRFNRLGRRKKNCVKVAEKKVPFAELAPLLTSNLVALKDYILHTMNTSNNESFKATVVDIAKFQVMLVSDQSDIL